MSTKQEKIEAIKHSLTVLEKKQDYYLYLKNSRGHLPEEEHLALEKCTEAILSGKALLKEMVSDE